MLYLFWGPNDFSIRKEIASMRDSLGGPEVSSLNYAESAGTALSPAGLAPLVQTMPFLGEKRLVVVRGLLAPFEPRQTTGPPEAGEPGGEGNAPTARRGEAAQAPLLEVLSHLPPTTELVLVEEKVSQKNPLFSRLPKGTIVREFSLPAGPELETWIARRARNLGGAIDPAAARALAECIGSDLWALDSELKKLLVYTSGRPIGQEDVLLLVAQVREANVFAMVDAVMAGRAGPALGLAHRLLDGGTAPSLLLVMLARQVRLLLQAKELAGRGATSQALADALGFRSSWQAKKLAQQAEGHSYQHLGSLYRRLVEEDLALKTGKRTPEVGLDLLVMEMCGSA